MNNLNLVLSIKMVRILNLSGCQVSINGQDSFRSELENFILL